MRVGEADVEDRLAVLVVAHLQVQRMVLVAVA